MGPRTRSAVALVLFNRPEKTERVFAAIARARPARLYLVADGPRPGNDRDAELCAAARRVVEKVDWNCRVERNYSAVNLGCGHRPASGIDWVFEQEEAAILLEDDGLPHPSMFAFCDELLELYAEDERIMQVSVHSLEKRGTRRGPYSYYFSRQVYCLGGFATWRRAWKHFDFRITYWPQLRDSGLLRTLFHDARAQQAFRELFDQVYGARGIADYWDHQWTFTCWAQHGLTILPNGTMLSNIGFGPDATHTFWETSPRANREFEPITFPLSHPPCVATHAEADEHYESQVLAPRRIPPTFVKRLRRRVARTLPESVMKHLRGAFRVT